MKVYQDLLATKNIGKFCRDAIDEFRGSADYRRAVEGDAYYNKHNLTIEAYQKTLFTLSGNSVPDVFSANYKLKTLFFRRLISQQVSYVCGNGVYLSDEGNKEKLGRTFDSQLQKIAKKSMASGRAFGFWNYDHMEVFGYADSKNEPGFCPLYDDFTAELMAGIRFWFKDVSGNKTMCRFTLYEPDGYTEFRQIDDLAPEVIQEKRAYKVTTITTNIGGVESVTGENYGRLPIVPLYANDTHESELVGIRESIDCYDFTKSGLADTIDDTSGFYWVLHNTGAMDDVDLASFVQRMKTVKAAMIEGDGVSAEAHTIDIPTEARQTMLEILRKDLYEDFQALDVNTLSASAKTTQEIQAAYQSQDNKCADFEYFLIDFVQQILDLAGIDDEPTFRWNRVVNQTEQTNMILSASNYLTDEMVIKHLPFLTPEEADDIIKQRQNEGFSSFHSSDDADDEDETEDDQEDDTEEDE